MSTVEFFGAGCLWLALALAVGVFTVELVPPTAETARFAGAGLAVVLTVVGVVDLAVAGAGWLT